MSVSIGYFPGCSGLGTSMEYERSTRAVCTSLGLSLREIPDWNCCGSTPAHTVDHVLSAALSSRIFAQAESAGITDVITPCPSCLKNLRNCLDGMEDPLFAARVEALTERPLHMRHSVRSVLQVLVEDIGPEAIAARVRRPLAGLKAVPYYGCLMTRPGEVMRFDNPENPMGLDRLLEALGVEVLPFPLKTDCCGASFAVPAREAAPRLGGRILDLAASLGADLVVVACPLCQMNLDLRQSQIKAKSGGSYRLAVPYYTQLMAYAFGLPDADAGFHKLAVGMQPALERMRDRAVQKAAQEREEAAKRAVRNKAAAQKMASPAPLPEAEAAEKDAGPAGGEA